MSVRTARGDETPRESLAAAADLFHKQGVVATSPDQIIDGSGTGKGQFYHYFKNKDDLVQRGPSNVPRGDSERKWPSELRHHVLGRARAMVHRSGRVAKALSNDARVPLRHDRKRGDGER
jgi:hypothetical protein